MYVFPVGSILMKTKRGLPMCIKTPSVNRRQGELSHAMHGCFWYFIIAWDMGQGWFKPHATMESQQPQNLTTN